MLFKRPTTIQTIIAGMVGLGLILLIYTPIDAYVFNWQYTGFGPKTIWDWLELLIIPLVLAVGGYIFTRADKQAELDRAEQQARTEREIAEQRAQDALLQTYLDQMAELLLEKGLRTSKSGDEVRHVAQTRTLIALRRLDRERRTILMQFLWASQLIGINEAQMIVDFRGVDLSNADLSSTPISWISLQGAIFTKANLSEIDLTEANLSGAYFTEANLSGAYLTNVNLSGAYLFEANLSGANLSGANLSGANLQGTDLYRANLSGADLRGADLTAANLSETYLLGAKLSATLIGTDLTRADLTGATFMGAELQKANLTGANLTEADLTGASLLEANLTMARVTQQQLEHAESLEGATMPDGSIHD